MAEDTGSADPSMEEILASIRKIISDENPPAEAATAGAAPQEDILELTQMVQDDGSIVDLNAPDLKAVKEPEAMPPAPPPPPPPPPAAKAAAPPPPPPPASSPPPPAAPETLVSEPAASSAASALTSLASTVEIERIAAAPMTATALGNGGRTLEDMVIELMRPLLKEWLDANLPATVDRLVQKEIERISRRS